MNIVYKVFKHLLCMVCFFVLTTSCEQNKRVEMKKIKIGDIELAYYLRGSGKPLVMIMGFRGTMGQWDPALLQELEKNYTLVLFDNRGVGFSTDTEQDLTTIPQMAEDTVNLIKALGYDKVYLLGWSMGSRIAQNIAMTHPTLVDKLILCSPNPGGKHQVPRKTDTYQKLTELNLTREGLLSLIFPQTVQGRLAASEVVMRLTTAIEKGSVPEDLNITNQTIQRQMHALQLWSENDTYFESLSNLLVPTLVASGLDDVVDDPENARRVANQIPFAWSAYFSGAGHAFLFQDYKNFSELVHVFLSGSAPNPAKGS